MEFVTKQEAENCLKALSSTHLYGRHLVSHRVINFFLFKCASTLLKNISITFHYNIQVIERAKEGETLEELRKRTADQFTDEQNGFQDPTKLSKKRKQMAVLDEGRMKFERISDY